MDQLRDWYIKYREREGEFPQFPPDEEEEEPPPAEAGKDAGKDAKGGKDAKKDAKKGKGAEEVEEGPPPPAYFLDALQVYPLP